MSIKALVGKGTKGLGEFIDVLTGSKTDKNLFNGKANALDAYEKNAWVYASAGLIAEVCAAVPLKLYTYKGKGEKREKVEVHEHELLLRLRKPNDIMTGYELRVYMFLHLMLNGDSFSWIDKSDKNKLYPLNPGKITPITHPVKLIESYEYDLDGKKTTYQLDEILHLRLPDPKFFRDGVGPVQAISEVLSSEVYGERSVRKAQENDDIPEGILSPKDPEVEFEKGVLENLRDKISKNHKGVDKKGKLQIMDMPFEYINLKRDMGTRGYGDNSDVNMQKILAAFRVPKAILGNATDVNRANAEAMEYVFSKYRIAPLMRLFTEKLNYFYLDKFDNKQELFLEFVDPTPKDKAAKLKEDQALFAIGAKTPNEIREERGMEPIDGGNEAYVPFALQPLGEANNDEGGKAPANTPKKKSYLKKGFKEAAVKSYEKRFDKNEKRLAMATKKAFKAQEKRVKASLKSTLKSITKDVDPLLLLPDFDNEKAAFAVVMGPIMATVYKDEGQSAIDELGLAYTFQDDVPAIRAQISHQTQKFAKQVNTTTYKELKVALAAGIEAGEGEKELAKRVGAVFNKYTEDAADGKLNRTATIARTEIATASNQAHVGAYKQLGVKKKEWASNTSNPRTINGVQIHVVVDGQVTGIDDAFEVGGEKLKHPGDRSASGFNVINCKCRTIAVVDEKTVLAWHTKGLIANCGCGNCS